MKKENIMMVTLVVVFGIIFSLLYPPGNFLNSNDIKQKSSQNETPSGNRRRVSPSVFSEEDTWTSLDGWERQNSNLYQTHLEKGKVVIDENYTFGHLGMRFAKGEFNKIVVWVNIYEPELSGAELYMGTSDGDETTTAQLRYEADLKDKKMYKLENGTNKIPIDDIDWGNLTFFKLRLERSDMSYKSPELVKLNVE